MELQRKESARRLLLFLGLVAIAIALISSPKYWPSSQPLRATHPFSPKPPLLPEVNAFSCINSASQLKAKKRVAVLQGPDWKIESVINPKCLPELELVFSTEEGKQFLPRALPRRVRFWITAKDDLIYVRLLDGSGSEQLDATALNLVTNHKCKNERSKNCKVQSTSRNPLIRID